MWKTVFDDYKKFETSGKRQAHKAKTEFSLEAMTQVLGKIVEEKFTKPVILKLPTLKKIELPKLSAVK
jgi:hypothetical protein